MGRRGRAAGALVVAARGGDGLGHAHRQREQNAGESRRLLADGSRVARVADAEDGVHAACAEDRVCSLPVVVSGIGLIFIRRSTDLLILR